MNNSFTETYIKSLEDRSDGNATIELLVALIRIQRSALVMIKQRCEADYKRANGTCLVQARGAIEACDRLVVGLLSPPEMTTALGARVVWSDPEQPSDA